MTEKRFRHYLLDGKDEGRLSVVTITQRQLLLLLMKQVPTSLCEFFVSLLNFLRIIICLKL